MPVKRHMHMALGFAAFAAVVGIYGAARAGDAQLEVTASLPDSCTVTGGTLAFGTVDPTENTPTSNTTFNVQCSTAGSVDIALDGGLYHGQGGNGRAMKRTTSNDYLNYDLYQGSNQLFQWAVDANVTKPVIIGANAIEVYGAIAVQTKPGGDYSDTVQITMTVN